MFVMPYYTSLALMYRDTNLIEDYEWWVQALWQAILADMVE